MARHSVSEGESFGVELDLNHPPKPGSRRAARQAQLRGETAEQPAVSGQQALSEEPQVAADAAHSEVAAPAADSLPAPDALPTEQAVAVLESADQKKRKRFSLFNRSRAAVVAVVAAASSMAAVGAIELAPGSAHAQGLTASVSSQADAFSSVTDSPTQVTSTVFTVSVDGQERQITTSKASLYEALAEAGILVDGDDKVSQMLNAHVVNGSKVTITRVEVKSITEDVTDPHTSSEVQDETALEGTKKVEQQGVDGVVTNTYDITYEDGKEVSRNLTFSAVKVARVDEVVKVGTKKAEDASSAQAASLGVPAAVVPAGDAQQIAYSMLGSYGWGEDQFSCLVSLWTKESHWNYTAMNRSSGAYGIPQALPGSKMASAGADWQTNPATQIKWGLGYIAGRYGTPCGAWSHSKKVGWY